ncbi:MAG: tail fiber protein, partial [Planctomycetota bacterium]
MRSGISITIGVIVLSVAVLLPGFAHGEGIGTAFTYQGRLIDGEATADGLYGFSFALYELAEGGDPVVAEPIELKNVEVIDGYFTVELDFGEVFNGRQRWLEIGVREMEAKVEGYEILEPRQEVKPTPYALYAASSGDTKVYTGQAPVNVNNSTNRIGLNAGTMAGDLMSWDGLNWVSRRPADLNLNNMQPYLCINYIIALQGVYPSRNSADPFLAEIILFGGNFAPRGWAFCDGQ